MTPRAPSGSPASARRSPRSAHRARSSVPTGSTLREIVEQVVSDPPTGAQARVWVADGRATALRAQGHGGRPAGTWRARGRGDHRRHRHDRPAGPRNRQLRRGRRCARAASRCATTSWLACGHRPARSTRSRRDGRVDPAGPAAQHGSVLPGQPEDHLRRGGVGPGRQRQATARRPQPAVDVRAARLWPRRPDRLRILRRHHRSHVHRGHRPSAAADFARGDRRAGGAAGARRCARHGRPRGRAQRDRENRVRRGHHEPRCRGRGRRARAGGERGRRGGARSRAATAARWRSSTTRRPTTC